MEIKELVELRLREIREYDQALEEKSNSVWVGLIVGGLTAGLRDRAVDQMILEIQEMSKK